MNFFSMENLGLIATTCAGMYTIAESKPEKFKRWKEPFKNLLIISLFCVLAYSVGYMHGEGGKPDIGLTACMIILEIALCIWLIEEIAE